MAQDFDAPEFDPVAALAALRPELLAHTVVSASIDEAGKLGPVGGIDTHEKLYAAVSHAQFPCITHFGMAARQPGLTNRDDPAHRWRDHLDGRAAPAFVAANNFIDLIRGLRTEHYVRKGVVLEDFVGALRRTKERYQPLAANQRRWLRKALIEKMGQCGPSGYLLLTMPAGWGKTAFVVDLIDRGELGDAKVLAWHFARRNRRGVADTTVTWDSAAMLAEQIEARLRLDLSLPLPCCRGQHGGTCVSDGQAMPQPAPECLRKPGANPRRRIQDKEHEKHATYALHQVIHEAGARLKPGQKICICIDGLDEAFGTLGHYAGNQRILPGLLPARGDLKDGIYILLTSRPGSHLSNWLSDPSQVERIRLEGIQGDPSWRQGQADDIGSFLHEAVVAADFALKRNLPPQRLADIARRVAIACESSFYVAAWFVRHMQHYAGFDEIADPDHGLPKGLDGVLRWDWEGVAQRFQSDKRSTIASAERKQNALRALLGILAAARIALDKDLLREMLMSGRGFPKPCGAARQDIEKAIDDLPLLHGFFDADLAKSGTELDWAHSGIPDWILGAQFPASASQHALLSDGETRACHAALAHACRRWRELADAPADAASVKLRRYALRWLPWHMAMAGQIPQAAQMLTDYTGWFRASYQQAVHDPAQWQAAILESLETIRAVQEAAQPSIALSPSEYFQYVASCG